jgi:hypothetical protein
MKKLTQILFRFFVKIEHITVKTVLLRGAETLQKRKFGIQRFDTGRGLKAHGASFSRGKCGLKIKTTGKTRTPFRAFL